MASDSDTTDSAPRERPDPMTVAQVAEEMQVKVEAVRDWIARGWLVASKIGRDYRVQRAELEAMIERNRTDAQAQPGGLFHPDDNRARA